MPEEKESFKSTNSIKGFTLVELIIVIAIIGILTTAVLFTLNPLKLLQDSRDTTRKQDLLNLTKSIQKAMIENRITLKTGIQKDSIDGSIKNDGTGYVEFTPVATGNILDISKLPQDPRNGQAIVCADTSCKGEGTNGTKFKVLFCSNATDFELNVRLENDTKSMENDGGDNMYVYEVGTNLKTCTESNRFPDQL